MENSLNPNKKTGFLRQYMIIFVAIPLFMSTFIVGSLAQSEMKWKGSGGWGPGTWYGKMYNAGTPDTIAGKVISVEKITPEKGMAYGVHIMVQTRKVQTRKEIISVHLGPGWYIENQDVSVSTRDEIEVIGSRIIFEKKPTIIASEIKTENGTMLLRNKNGVPVWSGWRRNQKMLVR